MEREQASWCHSATLKIHQNNLGQGRGVKHTAHQSIWIKLPGLQHKTTLHGSVVHLSTVICKHMCSDTGLNECGRKKSVEIAPFFSLRHLRLFIVCCLNGSLVKWWKQFNKKYTSLLFASILGARLAPGDRLWPRWALLMWLWCGACASLHLRFNVCLKVVLSE